MRLNPKIINLMIDSFRKKEFELENLKNLRAGQICATIANANRKKGSRKFKAEDFIKPIREKERQTPEQMDKILLAMTKKLGGNIVA